MQSFHGWSTLTDTSKEAPKGEALMASGTLSAMAASVRSPHRERDVDGPREQRTSHTRCHRGEVLRHEVGASADPGPADRRHQVEPHRR